MHFPTALPLCPAPRGWTAEGWLQRVPARGAEVPPAFFARTEELLIVDSQQLGLPHPASSQILWPAKLPERAQPSPLLHAAPLGTKQMSSHSTRGLSTPISHRPTGSACNRARGYTPNPALLPNVNARCNACLAAGPDHPPALRGAEVALTSTSPPHPTTCTAPVPEDAVPTHGKLKWHLLRNMASPSPPLSPWRCFQLTGHREARHEDA